MAEFEDPPPNPDPCGIFFFTLILNYFFFKSFLFISKFKVFIIVFEFFLIPSLNFPEKLTSSFILLFLAIEITSYKSQKVIRDVIL